MDNRIFNINGTGIEMLRATLDLAFQQQGDRTTCKSWSTTGKHGLILLWTDKGVNKLPVGMDAQCMAAIAWDWLHSNKRGPVEVSGWDSDYDHDGHNLMGWRVFCEDWGHVGSEHCSICAVKPAYIWLGK